MPAPSPVAVLREISLSTGRRYGEVERTVAGESNSTFVVAADDGELILKLEPAERAAAHRNAAAACAYLRGLGYPVPRTIATGVFDGCAYTLRTCLPGGTLTPDDGRHLESLMALVELQAGGAASAGLAHDAWPSSVVDPVLVGGPGYCLLETMRDRSRETAALLGRLQQIVATHGSLLPAAPGDILHYDFNPANILVNAGEVSGVIDWEGARAGDRAFDLATLLFYAYDAGRTRTALWARLLELRAKPVVSVYLAHVIRRQTEWSLRLHPPPVGRRYLDRAHRVLSDIGQ
jgi:Ser/Thr protein kinase RdoA (MazF antagonist)